MVRYPLEWNMILGSRRYNTFGWTRKYKDGSAKFHKGWDLVSPKGTPIFPVATGKVVNVQTNDVGDYGKTINLEFEEDGKTFYAFYAHLSAVNVSVGEVITATNMRIGSVGDTGNAKGIAAKSVHLHFEFRNRRYGGNGTSDRIDPLDFYGEVPYDGIYYIEDE